MSSACPTRLAAAISAVDARVVPHESWWIRHLARCEPGTLPFPERGNTAGAAMESLPLDLSSLPIVPGHDPADVALALTAGLLARLRGRAEFSVTYEGPELRSLTQRREGLVCRHRTGAVLAFRSRDPSMHWWPAWPARSRKCARG